MGSESQQHEPPRPEYIGDVSAQVAEAIQERPLPWRRTEKVSRIDVEYRLDVSPCTQLLVTTGNRGEGSLVHCTIAISQRLIEKPEDAIAWAPRFLLSLMEKEVEKLRKFLG